MRRPGRPTSAAAPAPSWPFWSTRMQWHARARPRRRQVWRRHQRGSTRHRMWQRRKKHQDTRAGGVAGALRRRDGGRSNRRAV